MSGPEIVRPETVRPEIVRTVADLRVRVRAWQAAGEAVALVPTMGALHDGHLALVRAGREHCRRTVVSIFVNPTQFGPNEDFSRYPREEAADAAKLAGIGTDLIYAPTVAEMYPEGFATTVGVSGLTEVLCGPVRPGHFAGVATIVTKLLLQALPDVALFGEKDYQQLTVIRRMVRDLDIPVAIVGVPTVRDARGLALSSRNAYLSPAHLEQASELNKVLFGMAERLTREPDGVEAARGWGLARLEALGFTRIDYLDIRDAGTLAAINRLERPARVLTAVRLDGARLLDNVPVEPPATGT